MEAMEPIDTLSRDLGDDLSEGERQRVTRVAMTGAIVSDFEARWVAGEQIALSDYLQACRTQCRLLALLGFLSLSCRGRIRSENRRCVCDLVDRHRRRSDRPARFGGDVGRKRQRNASGASSAIWICAGVAAGKQPERKGAFFLPRLEKPADSKT
jgi:hypothetical protein